MNYLTKRKLKQNLIFLGIAALALLVSLTLCSKEKTDSNKISTEKSSEITVRFESPI